MIKKQIEEQGCDPSGAADPRNKCTYFGLPMEVDGSSIVIGLICLAIGGQGMGQVSVAAQGVATARKAVSRALKVSTGRDRSMSSSAYVHTASTLRTPCRS